LWLAWIAVRQNNGAPGRSTVAPLRLNASIWPGGVHEFRRVSSQQNTAAGWWIICWHVIVVCEEDSSEFPDVKFKEPSWLMNADFSVLT
jgi:hypothetical protein